MVKRNRKSTRPSVTTSALPDIIFMLLFFFMVVTVLRQHPLMLHINLPEVNQVQQLKHRSLINHVYIGWPLDRQKGSQPRIQINDAFVPVYRLDAAIKQLVASKPEVIRDQLITALKVDEQIEMGIVTDVKTALRKANQLKVNYTALVDNDL